MPRLHRGLAGGDLALAGLEHLAHEHVVDLLGADAGALERGLDRERPRGPWRVNEASAPESLPIGVRADETMTEPGMATSSTAARRTWSECIPDGSADRVG